MRELGRVYSSNRRPLGLYLHAARLLDPVVSACLEGRLSACWLAPAPPAMCFPHTRRQPLRLPSLCLMLIIIAGGRPVRSLLRAGAQAARRVGGDHLRGEPLPGARLPARRRLRGDAVQLPSRTPSQPAQVLRWMANPVPASQYSLDCPTPTDIAFPGGRFCMPPAGGCVQGTWSAADCACRCINQGKPALSGFCPDPTGACTIAKAYSFTNLTFYCAGQVEAPAAGPDASPSPVPSPAAATAPATTGPAATGPATSASPQPAAPGTTVSSDSLSQQPPAQAQPTASPAASVPADPIANVQPLDGVPFELTVAGELLGFMAATANGQRVCDIVAALAGEAPSACTVAAVAETAAPAAGATRRLASTGYLRISLALRPTARTEAQIVAALAAMQANGSLAIELAAAGVQVVGASLRVLSSAPAHSMVGPAVAGAVGGAGALALAATVALVVRRARLRKRAKAAGGHRSDALPTTVQDASAKPSLPAKGLRLTVAAGPTRAGDAPVAAYSSSTSRGATPRHGAFSPTSAGTAGPSRFGPGTSGGDGVQPGSARADVVRGSEAIQMFN